MTDDVALLLRRAGFGPTAAELAAANKAGYAATLSALLTPSGPDAGAQAAPIPDLGLDYFADKRRPTDEQRAAGDQQRRAQQEQLIRWWLDRMTVADHHALEKLVFFWHGHWATSVDKVKSPQLMLAQQVTIRNAPDFATMARQMVTDRALLLWLDGQENTKEAPNENLARELMELFTLGIGHFTEADVKETGRALTGWQLWFDGEGAAFNPARHDAGNKTILGVTKNFDAAGLVSLLLDQEACPRFIASRLWYRYASPTEPIPNRVQKAMAAAFPQPISMLRVLLTDESFGATRGQMAKQPVEWAVGAMRQLGVRPANLSTQAFTEVRNGLKNLGQLPFAPPSVGGWPNGIAWLTSAAAQIRLYLASRIAESSTVDRLTPERLAELLCIERWSNRTYAVLREITNSRQLLALGLVTPEYLVT